MAPRADALADKTTTYSLSSQVSDPSLLGNEPDSWLEESSLRAHERSRRCAREQRLGRHAPNRQWSAANNKNRAAAKTGELVAPRADALAHRTTPYISSSAVSDPSELGSEPDSWLEERSLRAHERSRSCARE